MGDCYASPPPPFTLEETVIFVNWGPLCVYHVKNPVIQAVVMVGYGNTKRTQQAQNYIDNSKSVIVKTDHWSLMEEEVVITNENNHKKWRTETRQSCIALLSEIFFTTLKQRWLLAF